MSNRTKKPQTGAQNAQRTNTRNNGNNSATGGANKRPKSNEKKFNGNKGRNSSNTANPNRNASNRTRTNSSTASRKSVKDSKKYSFTTQQVAKILGWDFGLPDHKHDVPSQVINILSGERYGDADRRKSRRATWLESATPKQIIQHLTYSSLNNKLEDELTTLKSESEMIDDFKATQNEIAYVEDSLVDKLRPIFMEYMPQYIEDFDPEKIEYVPYVITSGGSFPSKVFPRFNTAPQKLQKLLEIVEYGSENHNDPEYLEKIREQTEKDGGLHAAKMAYVPKNWKTKRNIGITSREAIASQTVLNNVLRKRAVAINKKYSVISFARQDIQQSAVLDMTMSSVDLSAASERVSLELIYRLCPQLGAFIESTTPRFVNTSSGRVSIKSCGLQGYPLVFTVMAILVASIARAFTAQSTIKSNFGDDLLISAEYEQVCAALTAFGLKVNQDKSYNTCNSHFTESCGVDALRNHRYSLKHDITPVYLRKRDDVSLISFINNCINKDLLTKRQVLNLAGLCSRYVIYPWTYQTCAFHINYDLKEDIDKVFCKGFTPKQAEIYQHPHILVDDLSEVIEQIHGMPRKESGIILDSIQLWEDIKDHGIKGEKMDISGNMIKFDHSTHKYYPFILSSGGLKGEDHLIDDETQYYFDTLKCDIGRIIAFLSVYKEYGRFFKGSYNSYDARDHLIDTSVQSKIADEVGIRTPYKLPLGKVLQRRSKTWIPIPNTYAI